MNAGEEGVPTPARVLLRWLPVGLYVAAIFRLSAIPGLTVPGEFELRDKLAHLLEYAGLAGLAWRAARAQWPAVAAARTALVVGCAVAAVGAADEVFQSFVPMRESSVLDWLADASGAAIAVIVAAWSARRRGGV